MKKEFTTDHGTYIIKCVDMECIEEVIQLIARKAEELDLTDLAKSFSSIENFLSQDAVIIIPLLQKIICELEGSKEFTELAYEMMGCCTINNVPVSRQLFNDKPELREDYYSLKAEVVKYNLTPFLKRISGLFQRTSKEVQQTNQ